MSTYANWNGKILREDEIGISPNNRSFRYGDGCFETIKVLNSKILLADYHFQRLFSSLEILKFLVPSTVTTKSLQNEILELVQANGEESFSRVRLVCYRGDGNLYDADNNVNYIIQTTPGNPAVNIFNQNGSTIDFFPDAKKSVDLFSSIKSNNFLGYAMGAIWAKEKALDDCIICNCNNRIADATIANIFIVDNGIVKTPGLTEGCINGVMRKYLLSQFQKEKIPFKETAITQEDLLNAAEVFLTNAYYGLRWVEKVGYSHYSNHVSTSLYNQFIKPLYNPATF